MNKNRGGQYVFYYLFRRKRAASGSCKRLSARGKTAIGDLMPSEWPGSARKL